MRDIGGSAMTTSRLGSLFALLTLVFAAVTGFTQAPPKYDPATEKTFKGIVEELKIVPASGKQNAYLMLKSNAESGEVFLCPKSFLDEIGVTFKPDDAIEITGSKVKQDGTDLTLAREVVKNGETLTFRFKDGKPAW